MIINGREIGFKYTIGVLCDISEYVAANPNVINANVMIKTAVEMSEAWCEEHGGDPLTIDEIRKLDGRLYEELEKAVTKATEKDSKTEIEIEAPKEKGKKKDGAES